MSNLSLILLTIALTYCVVSILKARRTPFLAQRPEQYSDQTPAFDITKALSGPMDAEGMIVNLRGRVTNRFTARLDGVWGAGQGELREAFVYADGRQQNRKWDLTIANDGTFKATADDIIGVATGVQSGSTVRMSYRIRLPKEVGGHVLDVVDWMYLVENETILNRSEFRKFGFKVAEMFATFRKVPA